MRYEQNLTFKEFIEIQKKPFHDFAEVCKKRKPFIGSTDVSASIKGDFDFTGSENFGQSTRHYFARCHASGHEWL